MPTTCKAHPLRVGLSTTVRVDVHDTSGPLIEHGVRNVPLPRQASAGDDPAVDARIASIIAENAGPKANEPAHLSHNAHGHGDARGDLRADAANDGDAARVIARP